MLLPAFCQNIVDYKYGELESNNLNAYIVVILWWMSLRFSERFEERVGIKRGYGCGWRMRKYG